MVWGGSVIECLVMFGVDGDLRTGGFCFDLFTCFVRYKHSS